MDSVAASSKKRLNTTAKLTSWREQAKRICLWEEPLATPSPKGDAGASVWVQRGRLVCLHPTGALAVGTGKGALVVEESPSELQRLSEGEFRVSPIPARTPAPTWGVVEFWGGGELPAEEGVLGESPPLCAALTAVFTA